MRRRITFPNGGHRPEASDQGKCCTFSAGQYGWHISSLDVLMVNRSDYVEIRPVGASRGKSGMSKMRLPGDPETLREAARALEDAALEIERRMDPAYEGARRRRDILEGAMQFPSLVEGLQNMSAHIDLFQHGIPIPFHDMGVELGHRHGMLWWITAQRVWSDDTAFELHVPIGERGLQSTMMQFGWDTPTQPAAFVQVGRRVNDGERITIRWGERRMFPTARQAVTFALTGAVPALEDEVDPDQGRPHP